MHMRAFRFLNLAILSVLVGCSALVYAQDDKPQDNKPTQQEDAKPQPKQDEIKPQDEAKPRQDEAKPSKQDKQEEKQDQRDQKGHPEQKAGNAGPGGKGGHIPDDKFRAHFGRSHTFTARTVVVQGQPQFQYGGYSFQFVDVWPVGWAYTDECYIDYIDGEYFLFDLLHPGVRVAVFVVM
jgi:hemolysin activation/secretion protein